MPQEPQNLKQDQWTIGRMLNWTVGYLERHGSSTPRLDAELLLAEALGCQRIDLYVRYDEVPSEEVCTRYRQLIQQRAQGMPVAYLLGRKEFYSLSFRVTPAVLIPRPETELLVAELVNLARNQNWQQVRICDVGTGSGVIAICAAKYIPRAKVTAVDISEEALQLARRNAQEHQVADRIRFAHGDLLASLPADEQFEFVVSNPPYVSEEEFPQLPVDVRQYEPKVALVAGPKGTEIIERLVPQAAERLVGGGWLLMEINPALSQQIEAIVRADGRFGEIQVIADLARLPRVVKAQRV